MIGIGISNGFQKVAIMIKGYIKEKGMFTIAKKLTHKFKIQTTHPTPKKWHHLWIDPNCTT